MPQEYKDGVLVEVERDGNKPKGYYADSFPEPEGDPTMGIRYQTDHTWVPAEVRLGVTKYGKLAEPQVEELKDNMMALGFNLVVMRFSDEKERELSKAEKDRIREQWKTFDMYALEGKQEANTTVVLYKKSGSVVSAGPFGGPFYDVFIAPLMDGKHPSYTPPNLEQAKVDRANTVVAAVATAALAAPVTSGPSLAHAPSTPEEEGPGVEM